MENQSPAISVEAQLVSRITLASTVLLFIVGALAGAMYMLFDSPVALGLGILFGIILFPGAYAAHRQAVADRVDRAVTILSTVWYAVCIGVTIAGERLYGTTLVIALMPVLIAMPFVSERLLQRIIVTSLLLVIISSIGALFPPIITPTVPDRVIEYVQSFAASSISLIIMLSLWQSGGRLKAAAEGMRKAIGALQESEKSLELKVEARTSELEEKNKELQDAFREISDINEVAGIVNSTLDVDVVNTTIYEALQRMFTFDQMGVFLLDSADRRLRLKLSAGEAFPQELQQALMVDGLPLDEKDSFIAASVMNQSTVFLRSVANDAGSDSGASDMLIYNYNPMESILLCPLEVGGRAIGALFVVGIHKPLLLSDEEVQSIERYVTQMSTAVRNAELFQQAEESRAEAEAANETKGTFLANMSHEIRTPMNAIVGLTGLCLETELDAKQEDYLTKVDSAANSLRGIIDDILDFSKLEAGKFEFENIPFSLNDVLDNLATICMVRCQDKKLELLFQRDPGLPDSLCGDPTRLGQILINLAGNSIKFTDHGEIVVEAREVSRQDGRVTVSFDVRDSGIGMTEEQMGRLFQSFSQADSTISRQYGGTGLGLAISQQLTQMMGGLIEVSSVPGEGSSFHFTIEFEIAAEEVVVVERDDAPANLNVLVVDDCGASRDILSEYLVSFGYQATLAETGEQALDIMRERESFDLVLLDWMMPGMTGLDVALAIRDFETQPKVILLSSWVMPSSEHESMVDAFLAKPIKPSALLDTIMEVYGKRVAQRVRSRKQDTGPDDLYAIRGARVLVVDDSDINLQIACELLDKVPLTLDTANNGEEAVEKVRHKDYDCVLMDIQMPGMDGYTATGVIRAEDRFADLPILAMTANVMAEDRVRTREAGMNGHVAKPVDPQDLYRALLEAIPQSDYTGYLKQTTTSAEPEEAAAKPALPNALPGLDVSLGLGRLAGNESLFMQLLSDFQGEYANSHETIAQLVTSGEPEEGRKLAHKLRGIANNLGASDVGGCAEAIESAVLDGEAISEDQLLKLEQALLVLGESLSQLMASARTEADTTSRQVVDVPLVYSALMSAVTSFDPGATDLLDQLLSAYADDSEIVALLQESRDMLDNFNFADAEPLLQKAGEVMAT